MERTTGYTVKITNRVKNGISMTMIGSLIRKRLAK